MSKKFKSRGDLIKGRRLKHGIWQNKNKILVRKLYENRNASNFVGKSGSYLGSFLFSFLSFARFLSDKSILMYEWCGM